MNRLQRYLRELIAAGHGRKAPRDTSLVWRGQLIEQVVVAGGDDTDDDAEHNVSWIDRVVSDD